MRVETIGPGLFRASLRHGVHNFFWEFTPETLQDALRSVTEMAGEDEIDFDYSHAANLTLGMRMAVQDYEAAPCYFEQILERAGVI